MKTQCPNCKSKFNVNETNAGKQAKCPKCTKPFTIEPFIETPAAVVTPPSNPEPATPPVKSPEPVSPSAQSPEPVASPVRIAAPVESPAPLAPPTKSPAPAVAPVKAASPIAPPAKPAESAKGVSPEPKAASRTVLSKTVFVYCWMGVRIIAGVLGALGLILAIQKGAHSTLIATFAAADVFLIGSVAIELMLFYKMWAAIKDSQTSISPAKAVGFLFIPVFNIYWALLMITGFAEDYNSFIQRRAIKARNLSLTLFLIYAFAFILAATVLTTPMIFVFAFLGRISGAFVGYTTAAWILFSLVLVAGIAHFITYILVATKTCNGINALSEKQGG